MVNNEETERENDNWKDTLNISPQFESQKKEIIISLSDFQKFWDSQVGTITTVKNIIYLCPKDYRPIN